MLIRKCYHLLRNNPQLKVIIYICSIRPFANYDIFQFSNSRCTVGSFLLVLLHPGEQDSSEEKLVQEQI